MKLVLLFLLLPLVANSSSVSSLLLRHQSELTTTTTTAATATLAIDLKQKQLSADRAPDIEQESNQETAQAVLANQELTNAVMASLPGAITNGTNKTTFNDDWKLLEDGVRSKHLLDNMEATAPALHASDHWKTVPTTWAQALKAVHPKSTIDLTESELKEVANSSSYYLPPSGKKILVNYTYGQGTTGQMLASTEMNVSHLVKDINAAAGSDYFQTERKTKGMAEEVDTHTNDLLQTAMKTALDEALPPNIFDETMDESLLEVENK